MKDSYKNSNSKHESQRKKVIVFLTSSLFLKASILSLFLVLALTYGLYIPTLNNEPGSMKKNVYLNPALSLLDKKDLIVNFQGLRDSLTTKYESRDDYLISIYFEYLPTGANIAVNKDEKIWPASLIKIPIAMAIMKKAQDKKWKIDNELVILDQDKDSEYGSLYKEPSGTTFTIQRFLEETLINSDNTAHFVLLRNLDGEELEDVYVHLGMDDIIEALKKAPKKEAETDNRMTAKQYSIFFRSLYNSTYLSQEYSQLFLSILERAPHELLSSGIPENISFVHKTGVRVDEAVRADSGIVYVQGRPYILTVMVQQKDKKQINEQVVNKIFEDISKEIYTYVKNVH
jgi:beta-lactamase class A